VRPEVADELGVARQVAQDDGARAVRLAARLDHLGAEDGATVGEDPFAGEEGEGDATGDRGRGRGALEAEVGQREGGRGGHIVQVNLAETETVSASVSLVDTK